MKQLFSVNTADDLHSFAAPHTHTHTQTDTHTHTHTPISKQLPLPQGLLGLPSLQSHSERGQTSDREVRLEGRASSYFEITVGFLRGRPHNNTTVWVKTSWTINIQFKWADKQPVKARIGDTNNVFTFWCFESRVPGCKGRRSKAFPVCFFISTQR